VVDRRASVSFDPEIEAVLAWAIREGATNVIRHSGAVRCTVRVTAGLGSAGVEVIDDGVGVPGASGTSAASGVSAVSGNGLAGLRERAEAVRGRIEAGGVAGGGFRLAVSVPVGGA
jgi:two-component system, NarL family, sensor histidine kinase DesK